MINQTKIKSVLQLLSEAVDNKRDFETNDVDAAKQFELLYNTELEDDYDDFDPDEYEDEEEFDSEADYCNCSDPGCPCGGRKKGGL